MFSQQQIDMANNADVSLEANEPTFPMPIYNPKKVAAWLASLSNNKMREMMINLIDRVHFISAKDYRDYIGKLFWEFIQTSKSESYILCIDPAAPYLNYAILAEAQCRKYWPSAIVKPHELAAFCKQQSEIKKIVWAKNYAWDPEEVCKEVETLAIGLGENKNEYTLHALLAITRSATKERLDTSSFLPDRFRVHAIPLREPNLGEGDQQAHLYALIDKDSLSHPIFLQHDAVACIPKLPRLNNGTSLLSLFTHYQDNAEEKSEDTYDFSHLPLEKVIPLHSLSHETVFPYSPDDGKTRYAVKQICHAEHSGNAWNYSNLAKLVICETEKNNMLRLQKCNAGDFPVVNLVGYKVTLTDYFLVMPFYKQGDLSAVSFRQSSYWNESCRQYWDRNYELMKKMTYTLHEFHSVAVHKDIKLENFLLDDQDRVILADFETCHFNEATTAGHPNPSEIKSEDEALRFFQKNQRYISAHSSLGYKVPEVLRALVYTYSPAADIYNLGTCFWTLFNKARPSDNQNENVYERNLLAGKKPICDPKVMPPKVVKLIKWCWETREKRPSTKMLLEELETNVKTISERLQKT